MRPCERELIYKGKNLILLQTEDLFDIFLACILQRTAPERSVSSQNWSSVLLEIGAAQDCMSCMGLIIAISSQDLLSMFTASPQCANNGQRVVPAAICAGLRRSGSPAPPPQPPELSWRPWETKPHGPLWPAPAPSHSAQETGTIMPVSGSSVSVSLSVSIFVPVSAACACQGFTGHVSVASVSVSLSVFVLIFASVSIHRKRPDLGDAGFGTA